MEAWQTCLIATVITLVLSIHHLMKKQQSPRSPPGPRGWPMVGNLLQLKAPAQRTLHGMAKKYGPIMFLSLGSYPTLVISSSEHAKQFFKENDLAFSGRMRVIVEEIISYEFKGVAGCSYGDYWRLTRRICTLKLLSHKRVSSFTSVRQSEVELCVKKIWNDSNQGMLFINLSEHISSLTCNVMWMTVAGRKYKDDELVSHGLTFRKLFDEILSILFDGNVGDFIPRLRWLDLQGVKRRLKTLHKALDALLEEILEEHQNRISVGARRDFVDVLLDVQKESPPGSEFDKSSIKALILDMVIGGADSTATTIEWAMSLLMKSPQTLRRLQEEINSVVGIVERVKEEDLQKMKYLQCVVKETLRLYPPFPLGGPHLSVEPSNVCGYDMPKGSLVIMNLWAMGRDDGIWDNAEEFNPDRFMGEGSVDIVGVGNMMMLPFGAGRRGCPGSNLAIPIILLTIASFVQCFQWKVDKEIDMTERFGLNIPRKYPLVALPSPQVAWIQNPS